MIKKDFFKFQWPSICWAIFILIVSGFPGHKIPEVNVVSADKIVHFGVYGLLQFLLLFGFFRQLNKPQKLSRQILKYSTVFTISYGILMEILQGTVFINRSLDFFDMIANAIGAFCGLFGFFLFKKFLA